MPDLSRTLVTGFGPFGNVTVNPSATLAEGCGRPYRVLEVSYGAVDDFLSTLDAASFDRLVMLGVASERKQVTPELFARNETGQTRDAVGIVKAGEVEAGAPLMLETTLWTPEILSGLLMAEEIEVSLDAGTYLCNYISYRALRRFPDRKVGFLHVPDVKAIPLELQATLVASCIEACET